MIIGRGGEHALTSEQKRFAMELKQAKAVVSEPAQPKIKLKVGQGTETPTPANKKITIHVGRGSGTEIDSPAPQTADSSMDGQGVNGVKGGPGSGQLNPVDKARSASITVPSPSPSMGPTGARLEDGAQMSPVGLARPPSATSSQFAPSAGRPAMPTQSHPLPHMNGLLEPKKLRGEGKGEFARFVVAKTSGSR